MAVFSSNFPVLRAKNRKFCAFFRIFRPFSHSPHGLLLELLSLPLGSGEE